MLPANLISFFDQQIMPLFDKITYNNEESRTLINTRDTLLPKLLSGEIRARHQLDKIVKYES